MSLHWLTYNLFRGKHLDQVYLRAHPGMGLCSFYHREEPAYAEEHIQGSQKLPLMSDADRRSELENEYNRLINEGVINAPPLSDQKKRINAKFQFDKELETALRKDGFTNDSIFHFRKDWRRIAYSTGSRPGPIRAKAFSKRLKLKNQQQDFHIRGTPYYRRVKKAIDRGEIHLTK